MTFILVVTWVDLMLLTEAMGMTTFLVAITFKKILMDSQVSNTMVMQVMISLI